MQIALAIATITIKYFRCTLKHAGCGREFNFLHWMKRNKGVHWFNASAYAWKCTSWTFLNFDTNTYPHLFYHLLFEPSIKIHNAPKMYLLHAHNECIHSIVVFSSLLHSIFSISRVAFTLEHNCKWSNGHIHSNTFMRSCVNAVIRIALIDCLLNEFDVKVCK